MNKQMSEHRKHKMDLGVYKNKKLKKEKYIWKIT